MVRIPVEYQEVEYIQGTSNARIDTGIPGNNDSLVISGKVYLNKFSAYQGFFGNYIDEDHNTSRLILGASANGAVIADINRRAANSSVTGVGFYAGNVGEFKVSKTKLIFNGTEYSYGGVNNATANDTNILLNVSNPATTTSNSVLYRRWYYFRINDGDTALRNYIPCYRKSDSKPGMYDTVTNQFFAGYGTEEFIVGNDVSWDTASLIERRRQILLNTPHLETISDSMASFKTDVPALVKDCKVYFSPVQDLHGYDNPWPAGGGVNAIPYAVTKTETVGGLTFSTDGKGTYTVTGTPTDIGYVYFNLIEPFTIPDGAVNKIHFFNNIAASQIQVAFINVTSIVDTWSVNPAKRSANYSRMSNKPCTKIRIGCTNLNSTNPIDLTLKLMIVPNETVVTDYIPYENICPITGWTEATLYKTGKNLFDADVFYASYKQSDGSFIMSGNAAIAMRYFIPPELVNKQLTFSAYVKRASGSTLTNIRVAASINGSRINGKMVSNETYTLSQVTFTPTSSNNYIYITFGKNGSQGLQVKDIQLELSSEATAYEPYTGTSLTLPFPQTIYGGYVDLVNGVLVEEWKKKKLLDINWSYSSGRFESPYMTGDAKSAAFGELNILCNRYKGVSNRMGTTFINWEIGFNSSNPSRPYIIIKDNRYKDKNSFISSLSDSDEIVYKLATPITYQLTDGLNHITLGQNISPRPNGRSSTGGYANSSVIGSDGCTFIYFELGWPTEAFSQYSADISRRSEFVSDSRVLINGTTTDAKLGEMVISTGSSTDYDGDALVYMYVSVPSDCTDLESKRAYLAEHPIKITYPKKTPIPYTVDLTDLKPVKGTNNIWSNANNNIEVKFWKH